MGTVAPHSHSTQQCDLIPLTLFKALSETTRLACVLLIASEKSLCVCELEKALGEDQPKISRHLALLRKDNILATERRGKWVYYHLSKSLPDWAWQIIQLSLEANEQVLCELQQNLSNMPERPNCCS